MTTYVALARTAQEALFPFVPLLLRTYLLLWERGADRTENTRSRVVTVLFPSNSCLCWLSHYLKSTHFCITVGPILAPVFLEVQNSMLSTINRKWNWSDKGLRVNSSFPSTPPSVLPEKKNRYLRLPPINFYYL
jgi:hypothetical protein